MSNSYSLRRSETNQQHSLLGGGQFALGMIFGIVVLGSLLFGLSLAKLGISRDEVREFLPSVATMLVALASLVIAYYALHEQRRMRQAGTDPVVLVHLTQRHDAPVVVQFSISNVGAGAALNVRLGVDLSSEELTSRGCLVDISKLRGPIRAIPQNSSIHYNLGMGFDLLGDSPLPPFAVDLEYEDVDGGHYSSRQPIDVREMDRRPANRPSISEIASHTEQLAKSVKEIHFTIRQIEDRLAKQAATEGRA